MKTLNLTDLEKSDIKYKISKFPDGQQQVVIQLSSAIDVGMFIDNAGHYSGAPAEFMIQSRLNNFLDLEKIICAISSLRNLGARVIHLYVPYFLGARSDRKFEKGGNNYLKDVPIVIKILILLINIQNINLLNN